MIEFISEDFSYDFIEAYLVQQVEGEECISFSGSASVYAEADKIKLKMFCKGEKEWNPDYEFGKKIPSSQLFLFLGKSEDGVILQHPDFFLNHSVSYPFSWIEKRNLSSIVRKVASSDKGVTTYWYKEELPLPYNCYVNDGARKTLCRFFMELDDVVIDAIHDSSSTKLTIKCGCKDREGKERLVLQALSMATGTLFFAYSALQGADDERHYFSGKKELLQRVLPALGVHSYLGTYDNLKKFMEVYLKKNSGIQIGEQPVEFEHWYKIWDSMKIELDSRILTLCVGIEAVLKKHFKQKLIDDEAYQKDKREYKKAVKDLKQSIGWDPAINKKKELTVEERALKACITGLDHTLDTSIAQLLRVLEQEKIVTKKQIDSWKMRNRLAHGSSLVISESEIQRMIDCYNRCFGLFVTLICHHFGIAYPEMLEPYRV